MMATRTGADWALGMIGEFSCEKCEELPVIAALIYTIRIEMSK
jgi:hypothetical protein